MGGGGLGWWPLLASKSAMVDGQRKGGKGPNPGVDFSTALRASARHSQEALGWEMSLGFPPNSHWLHSIIVRITPDVGPTYLSLCSPKCGKSSCTISSFPKITDKNY